MTAPTLTGLGRIPGGRRYALSAVVEAASAGLLRPFVILYALTVGLAAPTAGLALTVGMLAGLVAIPLTGRWVDTGARRGPAVAALLARAAGTLVLVVVPGAVGFFAAAAPIGIGTQIAATGTAALIDAVAGPTYRTAALAANRAIRNAGLGAGAAVATAVLAAGAGTLRGLALGTAAGCVAAAVVLLWVPTPARPRPGGGPAGAAGRAAGGADRAGAGSGGRLREVTVLALWAIPFAFYADVLEVALPVTLVAGLHASPAWSSAIFVGNTVLVITLQVPVVVRLAGRPHHGVLAASGAVLAGSYLGFWLADGLGGRAGTLLLAAVAVPYTLGEILYTGSGTALVIESAPPGLLGRALARWQLSYGLARAASPSLLTALLGLGAAALWAPLAAATTLGAAAIGYRSATSRKSLPSLAPAPRSSS